MRYNNKNLLVGSEVILKPHTGFQIQLLLLQKKKKRKGEYWLSLLSKSHSCRCNAQRYDKERKRDGNEEYDLHGWLVHLREG